MATALALWLFATGRWGSYVGSEQAGLFVTEIWLTATVAAFVVAAVRGSVNFRPLRRPSPAVALAVCLLALAVVRLITSEALTRNTLRDFAPYGYAVVALLVLLSPRARWERSQVTVFVVLAAHATWVALSHYAPALLPGLPMLGGAPMFTIRPDFDGAVCGLGVGVCLVWLRRHRAESWRATGSVALLGLVQAGLVLSLPSRAALLASLLGIGFVLAAAAPTRRVSAARLVLRGVVGVVLLVFGALALAQTNPGERVVDALEGRGNAAGTTNARQLVWDLTAEYVLAEPQRALFGVGFGPDFMHETGADALFEGNVYSGVRSPHNYALGTAARLGILGAVLVLVLALAAAAASWRAVRTADELQPADLLAAGATVALPVVAAVGVVLESPFGAVPYFWAIGHLARTERSSRRGADGGERAEPALRDRVAEPGAGTTARSSSSRDHLAIQLRRRPGSGSPGSTGFGASN